MYNLLASDLDGTLIPLSEDNKLIRAIDTFSENFQNSSNTKLAYITGRHFSLALEGLNKYKLPEPDFLVCDVGTSLYTKNPNKSWYSDSEYSNYLLNRWNINDSKELISTLENISFIKLQENERQSPLKLSYYLENNKLTNNLNLIIDEKIKEIEKNLLKAQIKFSIIFSIDEVSNVGLIDILPPDTAKNTALDFICKKYLINNSNVIYAGDSGNDLAVIKASYKSILVGNAREDIKKEALNINKKTPENLYISNSHSALGVIEGARHFGVFK